MLLFLMALPAYSGPEKSPFDSVRSLYLNGQREKAIKEVKELADSVKTDEERARALLLLGKIQLESGNPDEARQALEKALILKSNLSAYLFFVLGQSYAQLKRFKDARSAFERVDYFKPPSELRYSLKQWEAEMAAQQGHLSDADRLYSGLERRWRRSAHYPEILWQRLLIATQLHQGGSTCRLARKLYSSFPSYPQLQDWGLALHQARVMGQRINCQASHAEESQRIRRLQLAGDSTRARHELEQLKASGRREDIERADMMLANLQISEGFPDEALKLLMGYVPSHQSKVNFLLLLAKAAARAGEYPLAIGTYLRAHRRAGGGRLGRESLFQAAFLSYQVQDYDGAQKHFRQFTQSYARSGLARDARWHLAWIRYLKGDFSHALEALNQLKTEVPRRRRQAPRLDERVLYWIGMTQMRMGNFSEARDMFDRLAKTETYSYYSLAARVRRESLPQDRGFVPRAYTSSRGTEMVLIPDFESGLKRLPPASESESNITLNEPEQTIDAVVADSESTAQESESENNESEETVEAEPAEPLNDTDQEEKLEVTDFKDPRLKKRFEAAQELMSIGLMDWARLELYEIERRTRNIGFLKALIKDYEAIQAPHRSSAISEDFFQAERSHLGMSGAKNLWESAYPKAYRTSVEKFADQFSVPSEWIYSIIRAESHYKPDVMSPVGARGLMQLMPETARQVMKLLGEDEPLQVMALLNPEVNIRLGSRYLLRLGQRFKNSIPLVAAAYNSGPHRVEAWLYGFGHLEMDEFIEHIPFFETRNYVKKVVRNHSIYRALYAQDKKAAKWLASALPVRLTSPPSFRENWEAL